MATPVHENIDTSPITSQEKKSTEISRDIENIPMKRKTYKCLTGKEVKIEYNEKQIVYPKNRFEFLFTDPITLDYIKEPVILNGNIYDKASIARSLRESDVDPLNGNKLTGDIVLTPYLALEYLLHCFEEQDETLIYHSVPTDIYFASYLIAHLPVENLQPSAITYPFMMREYKNKRYVRLLIEHYMYKYNEEIKAIDSKYVASEYAMCDFRNIPDSFILNSNTVYKNCAIPDEILQKYGGIVENTIRHFTPFELLITSVVSGNIATPNGGNKVYLTSAGYLILGTDKPTPGTLPLNLYFKHGAIQSHTTVDITIVMSKILDIMNSGPSREIFHTTKIYTGNFSFCSSEKENGPICIRSAEQRYHDKALKIVKEMEIDPSLMKGITTISALCTSVNCTKMSGRDCPILKLRQKLYVPFVVDPDSNTFGKDLSFLNLSQRQFTNSYFKDYCFIKCDMRNSVFTDCQFDFCSFSGADLRGTVFRNCRFGKCPEFIGTIKDEATTFFNWSLTCNACNNDNTIMYKFLTRPC